MPITNRTRPVSEQWKTSSSSSNLHLESWKMSGKPRHAQLFTDKRHSSTPTMIHHNNSPYPNKPLPPEPMIPEPFYMNQHAMSHSHHSYPNYAYATTLYDMASPLSIPPPQQPTYQVEYPPIEHPPMGHPPQGHPNLDHSPMGYPPIEHAPVEHPPMGYPPIEHVSVEHPPMMEDVPPSHTLKPKKNEKKIRQITVQSINAEHRVWIDVLPSETGLSLAEKIHVIATFRTRKVVSITTASGRKITLDNRPVFGSWMDMENFQDGERWTVEWRENDRGMVDKLLSKMIQRKSHTK
ncbi:hypothetical protein BD560DRAFT_415265 [Blakeslea trispora]|nr:hypothetical protein BD560DRAFT_415265 [Blakeslea trispora]